MSEKFEEYARAVEQRLAEAGLRVAGDYRAEKIGAKIRDAQLELIPYMFVVGGREMEQAGGGRPRPAGGRPGRHERRGGPGEAPRGDPGQDGAASGEDLGRAGSRRGECLLSLTLGGCPRILVSDDVS